MSHKNIYSTSDPCALCSRLPGSLRRCVRSSSSAAMLSGSATPEHSTTNLRAAPRSEAVKHGKRMCVRNPPKKIPKKNYGTISYSQSNYVVFVLDFFLARMSQVKPSILNWRLQSTPKESQDDHLGPRMGYPYLTEFKAI